MSAPLSVKICAK